MKAMGGFYEAQQMLVGQRLVSIEISENGRGVRWVFENGWYYEWALDIATQIGEEQPIDYEALSV